MKSHKKVVNEASYPTSGTTGAMAVGRIMNRTLLNDRGLLCRVISSSSKPFLSNNPFLQIDDNVNAPKADDELMELLSRIDNYVKSRNQGHNLTQQSGPNYTQPQDRRHSAYAGPGDRDYNYARQTINVPGSAQYSGYTYDPRQNGYNQFNRGYEAPMQPSSELSLVRQGTQTDYPTARVPYAPSSFGLFNDIVKQIAKFDGKPNTLKLFCTAVEEAVEQVPLFEQKIVRALQPKLVGEAEYIVGNLADNQSARELLRDLRDRFVNRNVAHGLAMKLGTAGNDVRKFGGNIHSLYDNAVAAYRQAPDINAFERESAIYSLQDGVVDCFLLGLLEPCRCA
uniref:Uncharacterized protein n=1 Tax=Trichogramma kaykai TaxID=54128 RepID=A0ABD2WZX8_9HYME